MTETYISVDVETDGPIPGPNSMLSLGAAAFIDGSMVATFSVNLETMEGAVGDPDTLAWWATQADAWDAHRKNTVPPAKAMAGFHAWVSLYDNPVFVGYPAGFDFMFTYWYLIRFVGHSPFSFSAIDMKTMAMVLLNLPYHKATKSRYPKHWHSKTRHSHVALDDAIEQGEMFCAMLRDIRA